MIEKNVQTQATASGAPGSSQKRPTHLAETSQNQVVTSEYVQSKEASRKEVPTVTSASARLSETSTIRQAELSDAPAIFDLFERVYELSPWTLAHIEREVTDSQVWLVTAGEESIACLVLQENTFEGEIAQIVVDGAHRRKGLARLLLGFLPLEKDIFLEVRASNEAARALYERAGFEQVGLRKNYYAHPVEDAILMRRSHE